VRTRVVDRSRILNSITNGKGFAGMLLAIILAAMPAFGSASETFNLSDYQGKVVILDFWASWCVPCRRSFPWMNEMQNKYGDDGLVIVAVNLDSEVSDAEAFLERYPADYSIYYDHERQLARQYGVEAMPSSFLIDREGTVVARHLGFKSADTDEYEAEIVALLGSKGFD